MINFFLETSWIIPFYGLLGSVLSLPWSLGLIRRTGPRPAAYLNIFLTLLAFSHGAVLFFLIWEQGPLQLSFHWLQVADLSLDLDMELSPLSLGALQLVTVMSCLAQIYGLGYLEKDWSLARFYGLMGFFEAALSGIALSDSLLLTYGLLEMLTLSTYLIVGFWYAQPLVVTAARDAFLTKRVGDIILLMGLVALSSYGAGLSFSQLASWAKTSPLPPLTATLIGLSLIAGPTGKCAQFPLNLWLDEAMEGPNPASILRNSVVVSAGAFVLIKLEPVFTLSPVAADTLIVIGLITAIGTAFIAIAQVDCKRALCHSTSTYLGLVFVAVGLGQVDIALLLLFSHAISKALLFMSIGSIILSTSDQNLTEMGGLWSRMPATAGSFLVGMLGLIAIFPLGMWATYQRWFNGDWIVSSWLLILLMFVNLTCATNLMRVFRLIFLGPPQIKTRRVTEVPWPMAVPMVTLMIITLLAPTVPQSWKLWLSPVPPLVPSSTSWLITWSMPILSASGVLGLVLGLVLPLNRSWARPRQFYWRFLQDLLAYDFYIEKLYEVTVVGAVSTLAKVTAWFDRYLVDGTVNLVSLFTILSGNTLKYNTSGQSQFYILTIVVGVGVLIWVLLSGQWSQFTDYWSSFMPQ
ncbi:MAG: NAD(P)H-quinone oxidoreductase subunit F [Cyanobacteria bacterium P01_H01_bin.15]